MVLRKRRNVGLDGTISDSKYVAMGGEICPRCEGEELLYTDAENVFGGYKEEVYCEDCGLTFFRLFETVGYVIECNATADCFCPTHIVDHIRCNDQFCPCKDLKVPPCLPN